MRVAPRPLFQGLYCIGDTRNEKEEREANCSRASALWFLF